MNTSTSSYLDAIRFLAALVVFIGHLNFSHIDGPFANGISLSDFGNDAVMVFFVLSGFIIAFVRENKETSATAYISSRVARLLSVAWPALAITIVLDALGSTMFPSFYQDAWWMKADHAIFRATANALLLNQLWLYEVRPFSNGPFWSLGYEAWFYALFIPIAFAGKRKLLLSLLMIGLAGPRIAILFPIWLSGVLLYSLCQRTSCSRAAAWGLCLLPVLAYIILRTSFAEGELTKAALGQQHTLISHFFGRSSNFLENYLVATLILCHFYGTYQILTTSTAKPNTLTRSIRMCGSWTFALYAAHYPIIHFVAASSIPYKSLVLWVAPIAAAILITKVGDVIRPMIANPIKALLTQRATTQPTST